MAVLKQMSTLSPLSIILLGEKQSGRSSAGNTILGRSEFQVDGTLEPLTVGSGDVEGRGVTVVNTTGWKSGCHPKVPLRILDRGCGCVSWDTGQGPHALLLTIPIYFKMRWNEKFAKRLLKLFDDNIWRHTILLFTKADQLGLMSLERYLEGSGRPLQALVEKCERRYHALNNQTIDNRKQVIELLDKIDQVVAENGGKTFQLIDSSWEEKAMVEHQTETPKMNVLEEQLKEMMERQAKLEEELHEWREREIYFKPQKCMVRSLRQEEEYPDPDLLQYNLQCNLTLQNEMRQQVEMQESHAEFGAEVSQINSEELQNQQLVEQKEHLREYEWSEKEPTVTQACEDRVGSQSEDECLGDASSRYLSMSSNDEEELQTQNESDSNDTNRAEGLNVMEKYADPEDKDHRKAIKTEKMIDAFEEEQTANKADCSGAAFTVIYSQIGSYQQGAVRIDILQVFICWKNPNPSFQTASISFIICRISIDWALFMIQFLFFLWLYLISKSQIRILVSKQPKTGDQNEDTSVFPMDQEQPAMEKHQREHQEDSVLLNGGDWTENLDREMLQPRKTGDDEGILQNNRISDHISTNSRLNDNEEMPQCNLRGHDREIPPYSRNHDEGLPQCHKNGDGERISDHSWGSNDEWIPQHILKGKEKISQHRYDCKQSNDDGTCQYHRKKDDREMPQHCKKKDNRGLPKRKLRDDDGGKPQHSSKKDDRWKPSYNIKKDDKIRAEHSWGRDDEGIPYYNIKRDDKGMPQLSKKKGEGGILQRYRKKSDWDIPQCHRRKSDGEIPQQQRKGDNRNISQHCCMKSEGTSQKSRKKGDRGIPQYNTKGNNGGIHQLKTKDDGGMSQHHSNRKIRKKGNREKLSHSMNEDDKGIPQRSRKNSDGEMLHHSRKNGDGEMLHHSRKNLDREMLQPRKTGDDEGILQNNRISDHISMNSRLNDNEEMPQCNLRGHDREIPPYSRNHDEGLPQCHKNGDGERISDHSWGSNDEWIPQHILKGKEKISQHRYDCKQSNDDGTCQYHRKKDDREMPQHCKKKDNRGLPKRKLRDDDGGKPQHSSKKDDRWKPSYNIKKDDKIRAEHSWGRDDEGIPYYNIKRDDKGMPQLSKKKGEGGILQRYRKKSDWDIPQCHRRKSDGEIPQQQRKGDNRNISQHCCMKSEGTSQKSRKKGDRGIPQYNTKGNNGGIHQLKTKDDGGMSQHHSNRKIRKKAAMKEEGKAPQEECPPASEENTPSCNKLNHQGDQKCDEQFLVKREEFERERKVRRSQSLDRIVKLS
ncbi:hypothetical protein SRHO_G00193980 [Serrasalmus rhombeus]